MVNTWEGYTPQIQVLIIKNIKADLARRINRRAKIIEIEPTEAPELEDQAKYEAELRKELKQSYEKLSMPPPKRQRREGNPSVNNVACDVESRNSDKEGNLSVYDNPDNDEDTDSDLSDEPEGCGEGFS